jgi:hypothetical protein
MQPSRWLAAANACRARSATSCGAGHFALARETDEDFDPATQLEPLLPRERRRKFATRSRDRAWVALGLLVAMVVVSTFGWLDLLTAAFIAAGWMVAAALFCGQARQASAGRCW